MQTVIIGATFMDVKGFSQNAYVPAGTNIGEVCMTHGGVCRNVCEDFANQGEPTAFVSMTDRSAFGCEIRDHLSALRVDLRHMIFAERGLGIWLAILNERGELSGSISQQPNFVPMEDYLREHGEEIVAQAGSIVLEIDMNERIARTVLDLAARLGKSVYVIVGNMGVILRHPEFLRGVRCFICNEIEAGRLFGGGSFDGAPEEAFRALPDCARRLGPRAAVVTMGPRGAVYFDAETGEAGHCPAVPAGVVDSTGAGDAFFAGTVMALGRGFALRRAVQTGARLASATLACAESSCPRVEGLFD